MASSVLKAASEGDVAALQDYAAKGMRLQVTDKKGRTALHCAAYNGHLKALQWLFDNGYNLNQRDGQGCTCLHIAAARGQLEVVKWIITTTQMDVEDKDDEGRTALHWSAYRKHPAVFEWLVENAGANLDVRDKENWTPLHYAMYSDWKQASIWIVRFCKNKSPQFFTQLKEEVEKPMSPSTGVRRRKSNSGGSYGKKRKTRSSSTGSGGSRTSAKASPSTSPTKEASLHISPTTDTKESSQGKSIPRRSTSREKTLNGPLEKKDVESIRGATPPSKERKEKTPPRDRKENRAEEIPYTLVTMPSALPPKQDEEIVYRDIATLSMNARASPCAHETEHANSPSASNGSNILAGRQRLKTTPPNSMSIPDNPSTGVQLQAALEQVEQMKKEIAVLTLRGRKLTDTVANLRARLTSVSKTDGERDWEIKPDELEFIEAIGGGNFGHVFKGMWRGCTVAIKKVGGSVINGSHPELRGPLNQEQLKQFRQEAALLKELRPHRFTLQFLGFCAEADSAYIVTDYIAFGDLRSYLIKMKNEGETLSMVTVTRLAMEICSGMGHLHAEKILHRDLACRNILVQKDYNGAIHPVISDFGLSRQSEIYIPSNSAIGAYKWMPPEFLDPGRNSFEQGSDVWCFGVLMWEVLNMGEEPWTGFPPATAALGVLSGKRLSLSESCPEWLSKLIKSCWADIPMDRPSFQQLYIAFRDRLVLEERMANSSWVKAEGTK